VWHWGVDGRSHCLQRERTRAYAERGPAIAGCLPALRFPWLIGRRHPNDDQSSWRISRKVPSAATWGWCANSQRSTALTPDHLLRSSSPSRCLVGYITSHLPESSLTHHSTRSIQPDCLGRKMECYLNSDFTDFAEPTRPVMQVCVHAPQSRAVAPTGILSVWGWSGFLHPAASGCA